MFWDRSEIILRQIALELGIPQSAEMSVFKGDKLKCFWIHCAQKLHPNDPYRRFHPLEQEEDPRSGANGDHQEVKSFHPRHPICGRHGCFIGMKSSLGRGVESIYGVYGVNGRILRIGLEGRQGMISPGGGYGYQSDNTGFEDGNGGESSLEQEGAPEAGRRYNSEDGYENGENTFDQGGAHEAGHRHHLPNGYENEPLGEAGRSHQFANGYEGDKSLEHGGAFEAGRRHHFANGYEGDSSHEHRGAFEQGGPHEAGRRHQFTNGFDGDSIREHGGPYEAGSSNKMIAENEGGVSNRMGSFEDYGGHRLPHAFEDGIDIRFGGGHGGNYNGFDHRGGRLMHSDPQFDGGASPLLQGEHAPGYISMFGGGYRGNSGFENEGQSYRGRTRYDDGHIPPRKAKGYRGNSMNHQQL
ncbi:hypothetical protein JTB14_031082 [Gonioctena quinquepunctata]|nr:hypothetical protein JTB14_031082 [Gonioctena quinquepunctata]